MTLKDLSLTERKKLTRSYPVLISAFPKSGKSSAVEFLSDEDKARTVVYDLEGKGLPDDDESKYRSIIKLKNGMDPTLNYLYEDVGNVKYRDIDSMMLHMRKAIAHQDVDRIVIDSFSTLVDEFEKYYVKVNNGFTTWINYNTELYTWFRMLKEETYTHAKFVYVLGHYTPAKPEKDPITGKTTVDKESERFTKVKGKDHFHMVESHFNTVVTIENFKFIADNANDFDSTRVRRSINPIETKENSLAELEIALTK
jgi:hypothetical protein